MSYCVAFRRPEEHAFSSRETCQVVMLAFETFRCVLLPVTDAMGRSLYPRPLHVRGHADKLTGVENDDSIIYGDSAVPVIRMGPLGDAVKASQNGPGELDVLANVSVLLGRRRSCRAASI